MALSPTCDIQPTVRFTIDNNEKVSPKAAVDDTDIDHQVLEVGTLRLTVPEDPAPPAGASRLARAGPRSGSVRAPPRRHWNGSLSHSHGRPYPQA